MNSILTVTFTLGLSVIVRGKAVSDVPVGVAIENPSYAFNYAISDPRTRDNKAQWEEKDGDRVNGAYSLLEPDGSLRVVEYTADDISGFSAIVKTLAAKLASPIAKLDPYPLPPINPLIDPKNYGFGAAPLNTGISKVKVTGSSFPWDPKTGSYGGWVPINGPMRKISYATILSKKYINGQLHKVSYGPIPIHDKSIILIKKKHIIDD